MWLVWTAGGLSEMYKVPALCSTCESSKEAKCAKRISDGRKLASATNDNVNTEMNSQALGGT